MPSSCLAAGTNSFTNSFCTSQTAPHWSFELDQNSHSTTSRFGSTSVQSRDTYASFPFLSRSFRACPSVLVRNAAGMVMLRRYLYETSSWSSGASIVVWRSS